MSGTGTTGGRQCSAQNARGEPCRALPHFVDAQTGLCSAHSPGGREQRRAAGKRTAELAASKRAAGPLTAADLPPLTSPEDAQAWVEAITRAVTLGSISNQAAGVAIRGVSVWLAAYSKEDEEEKENARKLIAQLKKEQAKRRL